jgi:hypothetical protein
MSDYNMSADRGTAVAVGRWNLAHDIRGLDFGCGRKLGFQRDSHSVVLRAIATNLDTRLEHCCPRMPSKRFDQWKP